MEALIKATSLVTHAGARAAVAGIAQTPPAWCGCLSLDGAIVHASTVSDQCISPCRRTGLSSKVLKFRFFAIEYMYQPQSDSSVTSDWSKLSCAFTSPRSWWRIEYSGDVHQLSFLPFDYLQMIALAYCIPEPRHLGVFPL